MFHLNEIRPILFYTETFVVMSAAVKRLPFCKHGEPRVSRTLLCQASQNSTDKTYYVDRHREKTKTKYYKNKRDVYEIIIEKHYGINPRLWRHLALGWTEIHSLIVSPCIILLLTGNVSLYNASTQQPSGALRNVRVRCLWVYFDLVGEILVDRNSTLFRFLWPNQTVK